MRFSPLILVVVVLLSGCTQTEPVTPQIYKTYNNPYYTINYPTDWTPKEQGAIVIFELPSEDASDTMYENVNVIAVLSTNQDMDEYVMGEIDRIRADVSNFKLLDYSNDTIPGMVSRRIVYIEDGGENKYQYMQIIARKEDKTYMITYSALADTFPTYIKIVNDMISSFKTKAQPAASPSTPTPETQAASPYPGLTKKWRVYSQDIFYDSGGFSYLDTPASGLLELKPDYMWNFNNSEGTWRVSKIIETDWTKWGVSDYGPTEKIVLDGWNNDIADGPIEGSTRVDFLWVIYRTGPPTIQSPGQIQMKFGWTNV